MEKAKMRSAVINCITSKLRDGDFGMEICELVWEELFEETPLSDEEDGVMYTLFNTCIEELLSELETFLESKT